MVRAFLSKFSPKLERRLLALCLNNPDNDKDLNEWNKNAVRYLVRELRKSPRLIDELERAISQKCAKSKCVTLPKTPDRRLLVSHRRGLPQVIYGRLWRWPDLQSHHQISAIHTCESSTENSSGVEQPGDSQRVCINPYHYERTSPKPIEPVLVPSSRIPPDLSTSFEDSDTTGGTKGRPANLSFLQHLAPYLQPQPPPPPQQQQQDQPMAEEFDAATSPQQQQQQQQQQAQQQQQQQFYQQPAQYQSPGPQIQPPPPPQQQQQQHSPQYQATVATQQQHEQQQQQQQQQQQFLQHSQAQQAQYQMSPQAADYPQAQEIFGQQPQSQAPHYQQPPPPPPPPQQQQAHGQQQFSTQGSQDERYPPHQFRPVVPLSPASGVGGGGGGGAVRVLQQRQQQQHQQRRASHLGSGSEIARPFRFKQNRFAHMARARHEHGLVNRYPAHDPHGYISSPYSYTSQPQATHIQVTYQQPGDSPGQQQQQQSYGANPYPASSVSSAQQAQQTRYAQTPTATATYSTMYSPQQQQYSHHEQSMQISGVGSVGGSVAVGAAGDADSYQTDALMSVATQQPGIYYTPPVAGTSQSFVSPELLMDQATAIDIQEVPYTEGAYWCSISYHEYDQRIGEKYHSNCRVVSVDGYTQPMCNDRFCIGGISNVNRDHFTEWVRRRIGRGVKVTYVDGEVYVEGLSEASVFVSNPLLVEEDGDHYIEHVSKLTLGCSAKVFSTQQFSKLLTEAVEKGFEAVYKLTNCCVIRVSFVKGWGRNYKRQSIFRTPCWVEVQLNGPLQWIDKVLRQMRPPTGCGSTS